MVRREDTALIFYDLDLLRSRIRELADCFPPGTLHALAIKANPLIRVMEFTRDVSAFTGVEAASMGEVTLALKCGYPSARIVYDSPVKTVQELAFALNAGIHINVDNLAELDRVSKLIGKTTPAGTIGLRINPQVGTGSIKESSVAGIYSKFGVPIGNCRTELEKAFLTYPWLTGVHLHVGSQGCPLDMLVSGTGTLYDFTVEMNQKRERQGFQEINIFDAGGGMPVTYHPSVPGPSMKDYAGQILRRAPGLRNMKIITEFGRWVYVNSGWTVSRVEYVKEDPEVKTAMIHVGADLFVRECLNPRDWSHEYGVYDPQGNLKTGKDDKPYNLAGPLCFSGDILAKGVRLPAIDEGDYLVIHDTGGYTFSMWSRYNSRQTPRILGWRNDRLEILKERESLEELHGFWA